MSKFAAFALSGVLGLAIGFITGSGSMFTVGWTEGYERGFVVGAGVNEVSVVHPVTLSPEQEQAYRDWAEKHSPAPAADDVAAD